VEDLREARAFFLLWAPLAFFGSWRRVRHIFNVDKALRKDSSSCFSIKLTAGGNLLSVIFPLPDSWKTTARDKLTLFTLGLLLQILYSVRLREYRRSFTTTDQKGMTTHSKPTNVLTLFSHSCL
jgi:hypothetical protein